MAAALGIDNLYTLKRMVIQNSNFMIHFFISTINTKVVAVKKELLKILGNS